MAETQCLLAFHLSNARFSLSFRNSPQLQAFSWEAKELLDKGPNHMFSEISLDSGVFFGNWGLVEDGRNLTNKPSMSWDQGQKTENQAKEDPHFIAPEYGRLRNKRKKRPNIDTAGVYLRDKG